MARRTRLTRPYPVNTLEEVLPISETIQEANGGQPVPTDLLADALGTTPRSSAFVQKLGSSARYGLTVGSHTSEQIELTARGESLTAPRNSNERVTALWNAAMEPETFRSFYEIHSGKHLPEVTYASNTLVRELGVRQELTEECLRIIRLNGLFAGIVSDRSGSLVVDNLGTLESEDQPADIPLASPFDSVEESDIALGEKRFVLVLAMAGDTAADEIVHLLGALSIPAKVNEIDVHVSTGVSLAKSAALRSARGCVVVWPKTNQSDDARLLQTRTWLAIGAASYQLGDRVVIVADGEDQEDLAMAEALELTVVDPQAAGGVFPSVISALVSKSIVKVSVA